MRQVNLVLSGGGVRGLAHIGVLKVLEEEGITVKAIAGCSAGALVGALYASCEDARKVEEFASSLGFFSLRDVAFTSPGGLVETYRFEKSIETFLVCKNLENLKIPFILNATDIATGEEVVFRKGPILPALRASIAYPGIITPQRVDGRLLVDGGAVNPLPVDLFDDETPLVICDVSTRLMDLSAKPSALSVAKQSVIIMMKTIIDHQLDHLTAPHVLLLPDIKEWDVFSFRPKPAIIIGRGEDAARKALPAIRKMLR
jgi:NTE family protein